MQKKPSKGIFLAIACTLVLVSFENSCVQYIASAETQFFVSGEKNETVNRSPGIGTLQNSSKNKLAWTLAQNNRNGSNGFSHLAYPNKAIVKNGNNYEGITPSNTVFAYIAASRSNTLTIVNATKSWSQKEISSYPITDPHDVYIMDYPTYGRIAFVCTFSQGKLWAINVTNPYNISTLDVRADSSNNGMYIDVDEVNKILYFTDWNSSRDDYLLAYDIANPSDMTLICKAFVPRGKPWSPRVNSNERNYVYVACEGEGLYKNNGSVCIFNVTWVRNASSPSMQYMKAQGKGSFADLQLDGVFLYGDTQLNWSLCVWDISIPTNLTAVSVTNLQSYNHLCLVTSPAGHAYAFLRHCDALLGDHGVNIVDMDDKNRPVAIGYIPDDKGAHVRDLWRCHWMQCAYNNITCNWVLYVIGYMDNSWVTFNITFNSTSQPPVADFTFTMTGLSVTLDGSTSYDSDGMIVAWHWGFGDLSDGTGEIISHTFPAAGIYTISVFVTDSEGLTDNLTKSITVEESPYQIVFISGRITNLFLKDDFINFDAVRIMVVTLVPFSVGAYGLGETFTIMNWYRGFLFPGYIFAFCKKQIINVNFTG
jgi:hypothetical protein